MDWAEAGKTAVFFHNGGASETCIGTYWYQAYAGGEWWNMSHGEPFLLRSFAGKPEKLAAVVADIVAGKEVVVPRAWSTATRTTCTCGRAKIQRLQGQPEAARLQPQARLRRLGRRGLPPAQRHARLHALSPPWPASIPTPRPSPSSTSTATASPTCAWSAPARSPCCRTTARRLSEMSLPGARRLPRRRLGRLQRRRQARPVPGHADRAAALHQPRRRHFRDDSAPAAGGAGYNLTAAAWIDHDGDGKPDILLGNGFHGLRLYRNRGKAEPAPRGPSPVSRPVRWFEDVSAQVGLGPDGIGGQRQGRHADGLRRQRRRPARLPLRRRAGGCWSSTRRRASRRRRTSGIAYKPGKVGPVFGDFDDDGQPDLFVPQDGGCKLFRNDGKGKFTDVTAKAGDLAKLAGHGDLRRLGRLRQRRPPRPGGRLPARPEPLLPQQGRRHLRGRDARRSAWTSGSSTRRRSAWWT